MAKTFKPTSVYYTTSIRDFYLDIWKKREVPITENDQLVTIPPKFDKRPDLMAAELYGSPRLWWVFVVRNPDLLIDPIEDFASGLELFAPSQDTIENLS